MKRFITTIVCLLLLAGNVWAIASIIVNRGRGVLQRGSGAVDTSILGWYKFAVSNEAVAGNYPDSSTFGNYGTQATASAIGQWVDGAIRLDGNDDNINIDTTLGEIATNTTGTVMAWVNIHTLDGAATVQVVFCISDAGDAVSICSLYSNESKTNRWEGVFYEDGVNKWNDSFTGDTVPAVNTWYHLALVQDGVEPKLYINGLLHAADITLGADQTAWFSKVSGLDAARMGVRISSDAPTQFLYGSIDDVRIYNRAVTSNEVFTIYTTGRL